tara:strand:- start:3343 stop:4119 length:777 start_codon:yes stop_codon:yes gene_type:complete
MLEWVALSKSLPNLIYPFNLALWLLAGTWLLLLFRYTRIARISLLLCSLVLFICSSPLSTKLYSQHEKQYQAVSVVDSPLADAIVLLGGEVGVPLPPRVESQLGGNRTLHAFRLYRAGRAPLIIVSGDNKFQQIGVDSESFYTAEILKSWGIPESSIVLEKQSRNTYQNAVQVKKILKTRELTRILLVTSAFHMPRAIRTFQHAGLDAIPSPSGYSVAAYSKPVILDWWPRLGNISKAQAVVKENLGIFVYRLRGWID